MNEENDAIEIDDIDLSSLSDDDLVAQMHDDLYDGLGKKLVKEQTFSYLEIGILRKSSMKH